MKKFLLLNTIFIASSIYAMESDDSRPTKSQRIIVPDLESEISQNTTSDNSVNQNLLSPKSLVDLSISKVIDELTSPDINPKNLNFCTDLLKNISSTGGLYKDMIYQALIEQYQTLLLTIYKPYDHYQVLTEHTDVVTSVAISSNGQYALTGSRDKTAIVWKTNNFQKEAVLVGHNEGITCVAFSPDCKYALTGSNDSTIIIWDVNNNFQKIAVLQGHTERINSIACSSDGKYILSGSCDRSIILWDLNTFQKITKIDDVGVLNGVRAVAFTPDSQSAITATLGVHAIWNINNLQNLDAPRMPKVFEQRHRDIINSLAVSPNGKYLLTGSSDTTVVLGDIKTLKKITTLIEAQNNRDFSAEGIESVAFSHDSKYALAGSRNGTAILFDIKEQKKVAIFNQPRKSGQFDNVLTSVVTSVAFSPDGKYALTGSLYNAIVWNLSLPELSLESLVRLITMLKFKYKPETKK